MLSINKIHKAGRIDQVVRDYFMNNPSENVILAKDIMILMVSKGIFKINHRDGLPLRNFLRELDSENKLTLLKHLVVERKARNRNWFFKR